MNITMSLSLLEWGLLAIVFYFIGVLASLLALSKVKLKLVPEEDLK